MVDNLRWSGSLNVRIWTVLIMGTGHDTAWISVKNAMGSGDDNVWCNEGAATEMAASLLQADDPWMRMWTRFHAADDTLSIRIVSTIWTHRGGLTALLTECGREGCRDGNQNQE